MSTTETKVRHTPGPWKLDGVYCIVTGEDEAIATVHGKRAVAGNNANVIAAAPDMLEALEELAEAADYSQLRGIPDREASDLRVKRAIAAAQAVCTKAKGGAA